MNDFIDAPDSSSALEKAITLVGSGSPTTFARLIGVSPQRLFNWMRRGVPIAQVPVIVRACGGALSGHEFRPDLPDIFPVPNSDGLRKSA